MKLSEAIKKINVSRLTSDMVRIPSYSYMERQEEKVAAYICDFFRERQIQVECVDVEPGRPNVIAKLPGAGSGPSLMFCGHMDTVPAYDMEDAFSGEERDGRVYGRGACDMKGPMASMMVAIAAIKESEIQLKGDLYFAALIDEEEEGKGVEDLVKTGPVADATIVGEPSGMNICLGQKGLEWVRIIIRGKKVHGGDMENGINAIVMASHFIEEIEKKYAPELRNRKHDVLGNATINIGTINGGDQPSTVPDFCQITLDRRYIPGETQEQVYAELRAVAEAVKAQYPDFSVEIEPVFGEGKLLPHKPFCTDENSDIVESIKAALQKSGVNNKKVTAFPAWTDAGIIQEYTDSKCIVMGPGELPLAHSANESIAVSELEEAARLYAEIARGYCKTGD